MKKYIVVMLLTVMALAANAQVKKITVVEIDNTNLEKSIKDFYDKKHQALKDEGNSGKALFTQLMKTYINDNKKTIDDPSVLNTTIKEKDKELGKYKDYETIKSKLSNKETDNKRLNDSIRKLNNTIKDKQNTIAGLRNEAKPKNDSIKNLIKEKKTINDQLVATNKVVEEKIVIIDSLKNVVANQKNLIISKNESIEKLQDDYNSLEKKNSELTNYLKDDFDAIYGAVEGDLYKYDANKANAAIDKIKPIQEFLPNVYAEKINKLQKISGLVKTMNDAKEVLGKPYNETKVAQLRNNLNSQTANCWNNDQKNQVNAISGSLENLKKYTENFEKIISLVDAEFAKYNYTPSKSKMKEFVGVAQARYEFVCQGKNISVGYGKAYTILNTQLKKLVDGLNSGTLTKAELDKMKKAVRQ